MVKEMTKVTEVILGVLFLAVVILLGCGEESASPTKATKKSDTVILSTSYIDVLNGEEFSAEIMQELSTQGLKLAETSTVWARIEGEEWLITDTENELAFSILSGKDKLELQKTGFIDYRGEAETILDLWATYMKLYNDREITKLLALWNKKESDYIWLNFSGNEPVGAIGAEGVRNVLLKITKGHHSTKNDDWVGSNMNEVYIKKRGTQLVAAATGPNAFRRAGATWVYFVKTNTGKWKISKVESIEQRNMQIHKVVLIHEKEAEDGVGFFDDPRTKVKL